MNLKAIESKLGIKIPNEYIDYRGTDLGQECQVNFKVDDWLFWDISTSVAKTMNLRNKGSITDKDFAFAVNEENQFLFYQNSIKSSTKISHLDEENDIIFYAFSLTEFQNFEKTQRLIEEIETVGFQNQDLAEIMNCTGSLFNYAFELNTSEYDENYSKQRNKKALELFFTTAEQGHPEAAKEIADFHYYQENVDVDKVIAWREKAIAFGKKEDIYELADFIADEKVEAIDRAIQLLESLFNERWYKERAMLKLSRIYMKGTGGKLNYAKGIEYVQICAAANNYNALSDLAFYYYKGMGVKKNLSKAYDLLIKAENSIIEKSGSGMWGDFIKQIEKELKDLQ